MNSAAYHTPRLRASSMLTVLGHTMTKIFVIAIGVRGIENEASPGLILHDPPMNPIGSIVIAPDPSRVQSVFVSSYSLDSH